MIKYDQIKTFTTELGIIGISKIDMDNAFRINYQQKSNKPYKLKEEN